MIESQTHFLALLSQGKLVQHDGLSFLLRDWKPPFIGDEESSERVFLRVIVVIEHTGRLLGAGRLRKFRALQ
jgi:hypothetical protein